MTMRAKPITRKLTGFRGQPALIAALLVLASCGGGDSTGNDAGDPVAYYSTMTYRGSRILALMVFEGGPVYGFFQSDYVNAPQTPEFVHAGFFVGQLDSQPPPLSRYKAREFDYERKAAGPVDVTLEGLSLQSVSGSIQREIGSSDTFTATYAADALKPTDTSMLAGRYTGTLRSVSEEGTLQASVDADGTLSATMPGGCTVTTQLKARPRGNAYDAEAVLGPLCPTLAGHYAGRALQSWANNNLYVMLTSEGFDKGVFLHLFNRTR